MKRSTATKGIPDKPPASTSPNKDRNKKPAQKPKKPPSTARRLSVRQERFCEFIASGMSGTDAWLAAGYHVDRQHARVQASDSQTKPNIAARIAELRKPQTKKALMTKDRLRELLMECAENRTEKMPDRLRAIEIDAKLAGYFAPDQVVVETGPKTLDAVKERAERVASALNLQAHLRAKASASGKESSNVHSPATVPAKTGILSRWKPA